MRSNAQYRYTTFKVKEADTLLPFIQKSLNGISHNRAKAILTGGGVLVDKKITRAYDFALRPGMTVEISKSKPKTELRSNFVKLIYEDQHLVVIE